jgi:hypothetical protein
VAADQQLGPLFADHRGRIDLAALAVLFDHLGGPAVLPVRPQRVPVRTGAAGDVDAGARRRG